MSFWGNVTADLIDEFLGKCNCWFDRWVLDTKNVTADLMDEF